MLLLVFDDVRAINMIFIPLFNSSSDVHSVLSVWGRLPRYVYFHWTLGSCVEYIVWCLWVFHDCWLQKTFHFGSLATPEKKGKTKKKKNKFQTFKRTLQSQTSKHYSNSHLKQKKKTLGKKRSPCEICRVCRLVTANKIILFALTMSFIAERKSKVDNLCQIAGEESLKMFNT